MYDKSDEEETFLKTAVSPIKENNTEASNITVTSSMQGNCDTQKQLMTTNSPDESTSNVILKRLEGLEGTVVKMVEKICSQHDDNVNKKLENKVKYLTEDKEMLLKEKTQLLSKCNTQNTPNKSLGDANALINKLSTIEKR